MVVGDYKIVSETEKEVFSKKVTELLKDGYIFTDSEIKVVIGGEYRNRVYYVRELIKYKRE